MGWLRLFGDEDEGEDEGEDDEVEWEEEDEVGRLPPHLGTRLVFDVTGKPAYVPVVVNLSQGRRTVEDMGELGSQVMDVTDTGGHDRPEQGRAGVGSSLLRRFTHEISSLEKGKMPILSDVPFTHRPVEHGSRRGAAGVHCLSTARVEPNSHINTAEGMPLVDGIDGMIAGEVEHDWMRLSLAGSGGDRADGVGVVLKRCAVVERGSHGGAGQVVGLPHLDGKTTVAKLPASSNDGDGGGTLRTVEPRSRAGKAVAEVEPCSLAPRHSRDRMMLKLAGSGKDRADGVGVVLRRCAEVERGSHGGAGPVMRFFRPEGKTSKETHARRRILTKPPVMRFFQLPRENVGVPAPCREDPKRRTDGRSIFPGRPDGPKQVGGLKFGESRQRVVGRRLARQMGGQLAQMVTDVPMIKARNSKDDVDKGDSVLVTYS